MRRRGRPTRVWSPKAAPAAALVALLGLWVAAVPLVGPYFDFGFDTNRTWVFSEPHWTLSIVPGLVATVAALTLMRPLRALGGLGRVLLVLAAVWLLVGPSFRPVWSGKELQPLTGLDWKRALLWVGYFYGPGAIVAFLGGFAQGLVTRRKRVEETLVAEPQFERVVTEG
jgi:hypothetical protein